MGAVNGKAVPGEEEVLPLDGPWIWSHMPRGYGDAEEEEPDFLQLPAPKILSDYAFDVPLPKQGQECREIVQVYKDASPKPPVEVSVTSAETVKPAAPVLQELHGRRKSLLIGINYLGSSNELHGCVDDVHRMKPLVEKWGFAAEGCCQVLLDTPDSPRQPTRANIQRAIAWLVDGAAAGDALFFHYSGHGGRVLRTDGRGEWHETLCPADMDEAGMIHDNELFEMLVKPLPKGCRLTCILDACHSAGALDLPFIFTGTPENIKKAMAGEAIQMALSKNWVRDFERWSVEEDPMALLGDVASVGFGLWDMWRQYKAKTQANQDGFCPDEPGNIGMTSAEVVAITGCASDQTSADVGDVHSQFDLKDTGHGGQIRLGLSRASEGGGALTCAFLEAMDSLVDQHCSILDLLEHLQGRLASAGFSQVPQLASSLVLDLKQPWSLTSVIGQSTGNNISSGTRAGGGSGLMGSLGNGLSNALAGGVMGGNPMGNPMGASAYPTPGMVGDGGLLGALGGWGGSSWFEQSHQAAPEVVEDISEEEDYGDDMLEDEFEEDFDEDYSDED